MKMPSFPKISIRGGAEGTPHVSRPPTETGKTAASAFELRRQAAAKEAGLAQQIARANGPEAGLATLLKPVKDSVAQGPEQNLVGVLPDGPGRWVGSPRNTVDRTAIDDMDTASAQHAQEQGRVGNEGAPSVGTASILSTEKPRVRFGPNGLTEVSPIKTANVLGNADGEVTATQPVGVTDATPKPEALYAPVIPESKAPDLVYGRGAIVIGPNTSGAAAAAMESQIGPSIFKGSSEENQQLSSAPLPDAADIYRIASRLLTKNADQYNALDTEERVEYLRQALNTYLENPSAVRLSDSQYAELAKKMAANGEVSQDETIRYAIDSTLRLINGKDPDVMKKLFPALEHHPELTFLITQVTEKMGVEIPLKEKKALINASGIGKGLFLAILIIALNLSKELLVSGFSDQRR
ncbi:MAG TPA: hypothetical protein VLH77_03005 [Gammaproteobacteria bacterium]|nr:hypothetical protein [Gammaproteobacteria bacterium]